MEEITHNENDDAVFCVICDKLGSSSRSSSNLGDIIEITRGTSLRAASSERQDLQKKKAFSNNRYYRCGQIFFAEVIGTGLLLFMVCMISISFPKTNDDFSPLFGRLIGSVGSGFTVATIVQTFGHVSSAHLNPAVTACFFSLGSIDLATAAVYLVAEMIGAVLGYGALNSLRPSTNAWTGSCCTVPAVGLSALQAVSIELVVTSLLVFMIAACCDPRNAAKQDSIPIKFGLTIAAISLAAGPLTGASMNPARTFAPALLEGDWTMHWIYWGGPMIAGFIVPQIYLHLFQKDFTTSE